MNEADFFQKSGTLAADAPSYIERPADSELFSALKRGELCLILAPRQSGKSSLMVRTSERLKRQDVRTGIVDLQRRTGGQTDSTRWFGALVNQIRRSLNLKGNSVDWWKSHDGLDATERFANFLEDVVLKEIQTQVVIFFDEVDSVLPVPFSDDFFTMLRSVYNARASNPVLKRLTFVLLGVANPSSFIRDHSITPFNVGSKISLQDFQENAMDPFRNVLGYHSDELIHRIFYWTGGQPYLVQNLSAQVCSWPIWQRKKELIDNEVQRMYLDTKINQDTHLKSIQDYILTLENKENVRELLKTYQGVLKGETVTYNEQSFLHSRLTLSGLVRVEQERLLPRNRIYQTIFDQQWCHKHIGLEDKALSLLSDARHTTFVPGYTHDVFVSYAAADDEPIPGTRERWVTNVCNSLKQELSLQLNTEDAVKFWIDPELSRQVRTSPEDIRDMNRTAIFMIILSGEYLKSGWCRWYENRFLGMVRERIKARQPVFILEKTRIEPDAFPPELNGAVRYELWKHPEGPVTARHSGVSSLSVDDQVYDDRIHRIGLDLFDALQELRVWVLEHSQDRSRAEEWSNMPYPGLRPFMHDECDRFFGREEVTDSLLQMCSTTRLLSIIGLPNSGKTSLVRAGLFPALQRDGLNGISSQWRMIEVQPGETPLWNLMYALLQEPVLEQCLRNKVKDASTYLQKHAEEFVTLLSQIPLSEPIRFLLCIDQFEDILSSSPSEQSSREREIFVWLLTAISQRDDIPFHIVITLRSDFLGACASFPQLPQAMNAGQFLLPHLNPEQLQHTIVQPIRHIGGDVEKEFVEQLAADMAAKPEHLPLLQHCLMQSWNTAKIRSQSNQTSPAVSFASDIVISLDDYQAVGGLQHAVSNKAEDVYDTLQPAQQRVAEHLFRRLADRRRSGGQAYTRRSVRIQEIAEITGTAVEEVIPVADLFRQPDCGLLMPPLDTQLSEKSLLNLRYECLIDHWERLQRWIEHETESAEMYRRLEQTARLWQERKAELWGALDVKHAQMWWTRENPNAAWARRYGKDFELASRFLKTSAEHIKKQEELGHHKQSRLEYEVRDLKHQLAGKDREHAQERQHDKTRIQELEHDIQGEKEHVQHLVKQERRRILKYAGIVFAVITIAAIFGGGYAIKANRTISSLQAEKYQLAEEIEELNTVPQDVKNLQQENNGLRQELDQLNQNTAILQQEKENLAQEQQSLNQTVVLLQQKNDELLQEIENIKPELSPPSDVFKIKDVIINESPPAPSYNIEMKTGEQIAIELDIEKPEDHSVEIVWQTEQGKLASTLGDRKNTYTAPNTPGEDSITIYVWNEETGEERTATIQVRIVETLRE